MVRTDLKLTRNGNATTITIPRTIRTALGWVPGDRMVLEVLDESSILVRQMRPSDVGPPRVPRIVFDDPPVVAK